MGNRPFTPVSIVEFCHPENAEQPITTLRGSNTARTSGFVFDGDAREIQSLGKIQHASDGQFRTAADIGIDVNFVPARSQHFR